MNHRTLTCAVSALATACASEGSVQPAGLWRTEQSPMAGVRRANEIAIGDIDHDGHDDVAVLGTEGELLVLLNRGSGRLEPSAQGMVPVGAGASGLAVGDVDGDGRVELVVSHHDGFELLVLHSVGGGILQRAGGEGPLLFHDGEPHAHDLVLVDVNRDGRLDLVQAQAEQDSVHVLLGDGAGGFDPAPGSPYEVGRHPYSVVVADFDSDGELDFAAPNAHGGDLSVGFGTGTGEFRTAPGPRCSLGGPARGGDALGLAAGDVNGDGNTDLAVSFDEESGLQILIGDGAGSFRQSAESLEAPGRCYGQAIADLDSDGLQDVVAPGIEAEAVIVWYGRTEGTSRASRRVIETPGTDSQVLALADLDEDGVLDVVTGGWNRPTVSVLLGRLGVPR